MGNLRMVDCKGCKKETAALNTNKGLCPPCFTKNRNRVCKKCGSKNPKIIGEGDTCIICVAHFAIGNAKVSFKFLFNMFKVKYY